MTQNPVDQAVVIDPEIDASAFMLDGIDTSAAPNFTVAEVSKFFFARSAHWVRWLEKEGSLVLDSTIADCSHTDEADKSLFVDERCTRCGGRAVGLRRTASGARVYDLADVEQIAHALAQNNKISGAQLHLALVLVKTSAKIAGYLG
jgi:hypothetical protein